MGNAPPPDDQFTWFREDRVREAMRRALNEAIDTHGNRAKAIAWDVRSAFDRLLKEPLDG